MQYCVSAITARGLCCHTLSHWGLANVDARKRIFYPLIDNVHVYIKAHNLSCALSIFEMGIYKGMHFSATLVAVSASLCITQTSLCNMQRF